MATSNTFNSLKPMFKEMYGTPASYKKPARGISLRVKPETVNEPSKKIIFGKLKSLMKY